MDEEIRRKPIRPIAVLHNPFCHLSPLKYFPSPPSPPDQFIESRLLIGKQYCKYFSIHPAALDLTSISQRSYLAQSIMTSMCLLVQISMARQKFVGFRGHVWDVY
ncbi:hypothetical protein OCU04_001115 [Sclerotinia nivalis]|uniref:Uncharacterized protein n=1 Tax=Sclerotinia nivalis TaxID=352851 RepID=A0A9X0AXG3_9HELO|nr:hypothetical protein OCU04_001115 [Sclerotinia nivalis]